MNIGDLVMFLTRLGNFKISLATFVQKKNQVANLVIFWADLNSSPLENVSNISAWMSCECVYLMTNHWPPHPKKGEIPLFLF